MINYIYAYEIVALFLIGLVTFFYHYKNWLPLYRNRFFSDLLHILLGVVTIELVKRLGESGLIRLSNSVSVILTAFSFAGVIVASVLFWLYYLAQTLSLTFLKRKVAVIMFIPAVITMVAVFASIYNKKIFYVRNGIIYYKENSLRLFSVVIIFYVLSGIYALTKTRKKLGIKQYIFMQTWNIVIICFLELYYLPKKKLMLIYYCVAAVIIIYYLIRHNVDMYIVSASGCFSMAGFKKVIEEKIKYHRSWIGLCRNVLTDNGTIWISATLHSVYAIGVALEMEGFSIINNIIWQKPNPAPNLACRCFTHSTETIIWARKQLSAKKKGKHYFDYHKMKEENGGKQMKDVWTFEDEPEIWNIPTTPKNEKKEGYHPTQKPMKLLERIIIASTKENDLVLDPFNGSGTTGIACKKLKRKYIGIDIDKEFLKITKKRYEVT